MNVTNHAAVSRTEKLALTILVTALALLCNWQFVLHCGLPEVLLMNDISGVLHGYRSTPNLVVDGLRWWHGTWIQQGIHAFRPVSAYLYWIDSWIGLHWGFIWVGCIGFVLFVANCLLSGALAWQLTRSKLCMALAAVLSTLVRFANIGHPDMWLVWYPMHQELLMNGLMLGALLCFDLWYERAERKYLIWSWALFLAGCLTKEHVYIFPLFALAVALLRRSGAPVALRDGVLQAALMFVAVLSLWFYRASILVDPRNPTLLPIQFVRKPLFFMYSGWGVHLLTGTYWLPGLSVLIFTWCMAIRKWKHSRLAGTEMGRRLSNVYVWLPGFFLILTVYLSIAAPSAIDAIWYFLDGWSGAVYSGQMLMMVTYAYSIYLVWKYRKREPSAAAWTFLFLSYLPVLDYIGWHYVLPAWFIRTAYYALIVKLAWIDWGKPGERFLSAPNQPVRASARTTSVPA